MVLGLDPHPDRLWPAAAEPRADLSGALVACHEVLRTGVSPDGVAARARAAAAVHEHCVRLIDAAAPACVGVKPQLACFERLGAAGWLVLEAVCAHARRLGLLVLADGKRGDVPVTSEAYGEALLTGLSTRSGLLPGLGADAVTANPLMGFDALEPLAAAGRRAGGGVFVLVRTSNPGARDVLDLAGEHACPVWERLAQMVDDLGAAGRAPDSGLSDIGAVTGATAPEHLERMRVLMPHAPFLLPGIGAQGGDVAALGPAFAAGRASALVTAARSIAHAHEEAGADPAQAARREAERLRAAVWALS